MKSNVSNGVEIIPTIVPTSLADILEWSEKFARFAHSIHIDAGDGAFVSNTTWFPTAIYTLPFSDKVLYEAHLMVRSSREIGLQFIRSGCRRIIGHMETFLNADEARGALNFWKEQNAESGLALLIDTPLITLEPLAGAYDFVLLMAIATLGKQGAAFDERIYERVRELHARHPDLIIAIDGGVSAKNIKALAEAGASRFSVGSAISLSPSPEAAYAELAALAESARI